MSCNFFDKRQRDYFHNVRVHKDELHVTDVLVEEWMTYFDNGVGGGPLAEHMRVAFDAEVVRHYAE